MNSEEVFLNNLLDFSNVPSKKETRREQCNLGLTSQLNQSAMYEYKKSNTGKLHENEAKLSDSELFGNNQKLLKHFDALREKLASTNRQNLSLKESLAEFEHEINEAKKRQTYLMSQAHAVNKKLSSVQQELCEYKIRFNGVKQSMLQSQYRAGELQKNRISVQKLMQQNKRIKQELRVSMQLSVQQKIKLEQQIQTLKLKQVQEGKFNQQCENRFYSKNYDYIRLENQFKKLKILYQEEIFKKNKNSKTVFLQKENQELKILNEDLERLLKKEKHKKHTLETKLLELEEKVRLFGTRTDIYEGELQTAMSKIKLVQKEQMVAKKQANQALNQKLSWQEKFYHSVIILEELISRVKRQVLGDAVELAKTCEFRLNKLKNGEKLDFTEKAFSKKSKSSSKKKFRSKSQKKNQQQNDSNSQEKWQFQATKPVLSPNSDQNQFQQISSLVKKEEFIKTALKQKVPLGMLALNSQCEDVKKRLFFNDQQTVSKQASKDQGANTVQKYEIPPSQVFLVSNSKKQLNLEAKIRKERQLMEKKLREKILYHKIEDGSSSPIKNKLREQYLQMTDLHLI